MCDDQGPVTVLFVPKSALGHMNPSLCLGRCLKSRGHRVVFATERSWNGFFAKEGFEEEIYDEEPFDEAHPLKPGEFWAKFAETGVETWSLPLLEQQIGKKEVYEVFIQRHMYADDRIGQIVKSVKPQIVIQDHYLAYPSLVTSGVPTSVLFSANPLVLIGSHDLPPPHSGMPINDSSEWAAFRSFQEEQIREKWEKMNLWVQSKGAPPLKPMRFQFVSTNLNIVVYPKSTFEDYARIANLGPEWMRIDHCLKPSTEDFQLPSCLADKPGKWIYVSLGSMASSVKVLNDKLISALSKSKHKFLLVKGYTNGSEVALPDNIYAQPFFPQIAVLPKVDLVITHGGNNTFAETLYFGKPMIIVPLFWDQYDNAQRLVDMRIGRRLSIWTDEDQTFVETIDDLLNDKEAAAKLKQISQELQASTSLYQVANRVEQVARNPKKPFYVEELHNGLQV